VTVIAAVRAGQEQGFTAPSDPADVTGDQRVLLNDVLRVVQHLRNSNPVLGEGERDADEAFDSLQPALDLLAADVARRRR
jgi:hypothetical protein